MEVSIVKALQGLANAFNDFFFLCITKLGEETIFLLVFLCIYLSYSKKFALKYTFYYLISVGVNSVIKLLVARPRPYVASSEISDRLHASGYSFPSGHTQGYFVQASTVFCEVNAKTTKKSIKIPFVIMAIMIGILVMISRIYWGQHYLSDVVVGMMIGISIPFVLEWLFNILPNSFKNKFTVNGFYGFIGVLSIILFVVMLTLQLTLQFYSNKVYKFLGAFLAISIGYFVDNKFINYESNQGLKLSLLKTMITLAVVVGVYLLIDIIVPINSYLYFLVYLFLGLICSIILPMLFKFIFTKGKNNG